MKENIIYTKSYCPYCHRARNALEDLGITYTEIDVTDDQALQQQMRSLSGRSTVPQIFLAGHHIGGSDDLMEAIHSGRLQSMLRGSAEAA